MKHNKLELRWTNKDKSLYYDLETGKYEWVDKRDPRVSEPRILVEKSSYGDKNTENILIKGDNLLALRSLLPDYRSKIKMVFADPPYNTGNAFVHYNDGLEHSIWLSLMKARLEILYQLLSKDGSMWITIDDDESHYLKILCDEIFGRTNFVANVIWEKKYTIANDAKWFSDSHDHILVYAKNKESWRPNRLPRTKKMKSAYKNPDNDPRGGWKATPLHAKSGTEKKVKFTYTFNNGVIWTPPAGAFPRFSRETLTKLDENNEIWFGKEGKSTPSRKTFLSGLKRSGVPPKTIWKFDEVGHNHEAREEIKVFNPQDVFATTKPERLLMRIVKLSTKENDLVLDSFAGSGSTGAVAHKMGRRWIMVEIGDHVRTHIIPRLKRVISGEDHRGISKLVGWERGGGFKYFELGDSLFVRDVDLKMTVINPKMYNGALIQAVLKIEGFKSVNPDNALHGISGTTSAHITEQYLNQAYLDVLLNEIGDKAEYVMVYAKTISSKLKVPENVEIKRIPEVLLKKFTI